MLCHYDKHNENRATLSRSRLMSCSGGCGASVHEGCANPMQDDGCRRAIDGGTWTCMLCMEDESLGEVLPSEGRSLPALQCWLGALRLRAP